MIGDGCYAFNALSTSAGDNTLRARTEELQSAADHIRMANFDYNPNKYRTLTVTEEMQHGRPVYTVTSSRGSSDQAREDSGRRNLRMGGRYAAGPPHIYAHEIRCSASRWTLQRPGPRSWNILASKSRLMIYISCHLPVFFLEK
jgi:hypothetical protein